MAEFDRSTVQLTVLRQQVVGSSDDELLYQTAQLFELLLALRLDGVCGVCVATTDDGILEVLPEVILRSKEIRVCEVEQREVF